MSKSRKKKLIFSSNSSWSVYNFRRNLLLTLKEQGFDIYIIAPESEYLDKLQNFGFKIFPIIIDNSTKNIFYNIKYFFDLFKLYRNIKPDIVLQNAIKPNIFGSLVCYFLRIPAINNISGLGAMFMNNGISSFIGKALYRLSQHNVKTIFFQNSSDLSYFISNNLVVKERCLLIPGSGVDLKLFTPNSIVRNDEKIKFCFVGRLIGDKGIFEFIEAAKKIKSHYSYTEFYILGELYLNHPTSVSKEKLQEWIDLKLVIYLGKSDHVENELSKFDCIVLPSYREGLSRVLLEASSMAIPAITTNVAGCIDVIENGKNGFICKVKDCEDLYLQMEKFIKLTKEEKITMGTNGRKKVEKEFDEKIVINTYLKTIEKILS